MLDEALSNLLAALLQLLTLGVATFTAYVISRLSSRQEEWAEETAAKVEQVKGALDQRSEQASRAMDGLAKVTHATHALANSQRTEQLRMIAELARWKADQSDNAAYIRAAEDAERRYAEQMAGQAVVDRQPGTDAQKRGDPPNPGG